MSRDQKTNEYCGVCGRSLRIGEKHVCTNCQKDKCKTCEDIYDCHIIGTTGCGIYVKEIPKASH